MDVIELLSELEDIVDKGFEIPFAKKTLINKEQVMSLIIKPSSPTASNTPCTSIWPNPDNGTVAPAPAKSTRC